jgi:hypothetical protein
MIQVVPQMTTTAKYSNPSVMTALAPSRLHAVGTES